MKSYNCADTCARKTTNYWLFHPLSLFAVKSSSCLPRLPLSQHKFAFNIFLFIPLLPMWEFDFLFSFFFSLFNCSSLVFWHNQRRGALFNNLFFFLKVVKSLVKQKETGRLWCHPFKGWRDDRRRDGFLARWLAYHQSEGRNIIMSLYASWMT